MGKGRLGDALAFVRDRDPQKYPVPPPFFDFLAMQLQETGDQEALKQCHLTCLERFPHHKGARQALINLGVEVPDPPKEKTIDLPAVLLARYTGEYHFKPSDASIFVTVAEGSLMVKAPFSEKAEIAVPIDEHRFRFGDFGAEVIFKMSEDSPAETLTLQMGDRKILCPRVTRN